MDAYRGRVKRLYTVKDNILVSVGNRSPEDRIKFW